MKERERRLERLRAVEREFDTAVVAIQALGERLKADPSTLDVFGLAARDFRTLESNLEATYLVRLFAEFETGLRAAWTRAFRRKSHPPVMDLLNGVAARRSMSRKWLDDVHEVRAYRNSLVHEESEQGSSIDLHEAGDRLRRFFSQLPADW